MSAQYPMFDRAHDLDWHYCDTCNSIGQVGDGFCGDPYCAGNCLEQVPCPTCQGCGLTVTGTGPAVEIAQVLFVDLMNANPYATSPDYMDALDQAHLLAGGTVAA